MYHPLSLGIDLIGWQWFNLREADPAFRKFATRVFRRDDHTCQYCHFQNQDFFYISNVDNNYENNKLKNMATTCCICMQCIFLNAINDFGYGGGTLIHAPHFSQNQINSLIHTIFFSIAGDTEFKKVGKEVISTLKKGSYNIESKYGQGASNPINFSRMILGSSLASKSIEKKIMSEIRLLPDFNKFIKQTKHWIKK